MHAKRNGSRARKAIAAIVGLSVAAVTALAAWPILGAPIGTTTLCGLAIAGTGLWLAGARRAATSVTAPPTTREAVST